ncbi:hypothetical protein ACRALDRAFT_2034054, partial [Sodiomyces alcalophilus JCM 7366]|uniref:uncharacterized protein n=1 Tax=Sodiomyces alcalophilus JCM 7366 TaxID=591952 RepID=UPI0039B65167
KKKKRKKETERRVSGPIASEISATAEAHAHIALARWTAERNRLCKKKVGVVESGNQKEARTVWGCGHHLEGVIANGESVVYEVCSDSRSQVALKFCIQAPQEALSDLLNDHVAHPCLMDVWSADGDGFQHVWNPLSVSRCYQHGAIREEGCVATRAGQKGVGRRRLGEGEGGGRKMQ